MHVHLSSRSEIYIYNLMNIELTTAFKEVFSIKGFSGSTPRTTNISPWVNVAPGAFLPLLIAFLQICKSSYAILNGDM